jgi:hypothetical protein
MRRMWGRLGGQLGLACIGIGLLLIGIGWNGAAGIDFVSGQIPYLLSGGALGLGLIILGGTLVIAQNSRRDRAIIESQLRELNVTITRLANAVAGTPAGFNGHGIDGERVALGRSSFHRMDCRLAAGKGLPVSTVGAALAEGLTPCRVCHPEELEALAVRSR